MVGSRSRTVLSTARSASKAPRRCVCRPRISSCCAVSSGDSAMRFSVHATDSDAMCFRLRGCCCSFGFERPPLLLLLLPLLLLLFLLPLFAELVAEATLSCCGAFTFRLLVVLDGGDEGDSAEAEPGAAAETEEEEAAAAAAAAAVEASEPMGAPNNAGLVADCCMVAQGDAPVVDDDPAVVDQSALGGRWKAPPLGARKTQDSVAKGAVSRSRAWVVVVHLRMVWSAAGAAAVRILRRGRVSSTVVVRAAWGSPAETGGFGDGGGLSEITAFFTHQERQKKVVGDLMVQYQGKSTRRRRFVTKPSG
jgi:hypothetical protein